MLFRSPLERPDLGRGTRQSRIRPRRVVASANVSQLDKAPACQALPHRSIANSRGNTRVRAEACRIDAPRNYLLVLGRRPPRFPAHSDELPRYATARSQYVRLLMAGRWHRKQSARRHVRGRDPAANAAALETIANRIGNFRVWEA